MASNQEVRSLTVVAALDASGVATGAHKLESAIDGVKQSFSSMNTLLGQSERRFVEGAKNLQDYYAQIGKFDRAVQAGKAEASSFIPIIIGMSQKMGVLADETQLASAGFLKIAPAVSAANAALAKQGIQVGSTTDSLKAMRNEFDNVFRVQQAHLAQVERIAAAERSGAISSKVAAEAKVKAQADLNRNLIGTSEDKNSFARKYDPAFAILERYKQYRVDLAAEVKKGLPIDEARRQNAEFKAVIEQQVQYARTPYGSGRSSERKERAARYQASNFAAQFQDIGVTAAMGMNPTMIALQQGTQISSLITEMGGIKAASTALLTGLTSVFSMTGLLTIGAIAAGAAFIQWLVSSKSSADKLKDSLSSLNDVQKSLAESQKARGNGTSQFVKDPRVAIVQAQTSINEQQKTLLELNKSLNEVPFFSGGGARGTSKSGASRTSGADLDGIKKLNSALNQVQANTALSTGEMAKYLLEVSKLSTNSKYSDGFKIQAKSALDAISSIDDLRRKIAEVQAQIEAAQRAAIAADKSRAQFHIGEVGNSTSLFDSQETMRKQREKASYDADMAALYARSPAQKAAAARQQAGASYQDESAQARADRINLEGKRALATATKSLQDAEDARIRGIKSGLASQQLEADLLGKNVIEAARLRYEFTALSAAKEASSANGVGVSAAEQAAIADGANRAAEIAQQNQAYAAQKRMQAMNDNVAASRLDLELIGQSVGRATELKFQFDAIAQIKERIANGELVGQDELDNVNRAAVAMGKIAEAKAKASLNESIRFETDQLFRTKSNADIASRLNGAGLPVDFNSAEAQAIGTLNQMTEMRDASRTFFSDLKSSFTSNGGDIGKAFAQAFMNAMSKAADKGMQLFADMVTAAIFGGGKGRGALTGNFDGANTVPSGVGNIFSGITSSASSLNSAGSNVIDMKSRTRMGNIGGTGSMSAYRDAIAAVESVGSGGYAALGPVITRRNGTQDRAYGRYQMMGSNIPSWSKDALGRSISTRDFMANPRLQDRIFDNQFGKSLRQYGNPQDAASVWFTGRPRSRGGNARDILGTSGNEYVSKFNNALGSSGPVASITALGEASKKATSGISTMGTGLAGFAKALGGGKSGGNGIFNLPSLTFGSAKPSKNSGGGGFLGSILGFIGGLFGFEDGGYTGNGGKSAPAGIVHRGEYVFDAKSTAAIGVANLESIRKGMKGYESGGYVGSVASSPYAKFINSQSNDNQPKQREGGASNAVFNINVVGAQGDDSIRKNTALAVNEAIARNNERMSRGGSATINATHTKLRA